jgi:Rps23 Pro-64 3,4-dihydroxylase Tpa1-like proline 4-hydroxylase
MKIINNFIDPKFIKELHKENKNLLFENVWRSNISWQEEIISHCGTVLIRSLNETQTKKIVKALIKNGLVSIDEEIELEAEVYIWKRLSYIPWHSDKENNNEIRYAATLYINETWDDNWGGLFLYKINNSILAEAPSFNKLIFNNKNYLHATSMLAVHAPYRETIQLFWKIIQK